MKRIACFILTTFAASLVIAEERKIRVELDTPATNYRVAIQEVYRVGEQLWAISKVSTEGDFGGAAITRVADEVAVEAPDDIPIVHKVLGKTWNWGKDTKSLQYVKDERDLKELLKRKEAKRIWEREKPKAK